MSYSAPAITSAGLSVPSFSDIQSSLVQSYSAIYGTSAYLGNDSADYQWISAVALKLSDNAQLCQLAYNSRSPLTATGAGLDSIVKLNGLTRLSASNSTAVLTLSGTGGTVVTGAIVSDANGNLWLLPSPLTIGNNGIVSATATCQTPGAVSANANTITTPAGGFTAGWTSVTNAGPAVVGTPVESDSQLRARQAISVALPSETRLAGTVAALRALSGVTRINVLENQTSVTDSYGNAGHSMTAVVEGGTDLAIATAIYNNRGIGCNTQGATAATMTIVPVADPNTNYITDIGFLRPVDVPIYVAISVHGLTANFTTAMQTNIIAAIVAFLNGLQIGEEVPQSSLVGAALSVMTNPLRPDFSIKSLTLGTSSGSLSTSDVTLAFYQVAYGATNNITLTAV